MTAHEVVGGDLFLYRRLLPADGLRVLAPGMDMASRRSIGGVGDFTLEDDPPGAQARIRFGHRGQEGLGVGMLRGCEQLFGRRHLHDLADVHHRDAVADVLDDAEVVSDEQIGESKALLKLEEEVQDLRLDRHVQGGDRFVRNDQTRIQGQGPGDADALTLAAREGMRVTAHVFRPQTDEAQELDDPVGCRPARCLRRGRAGAPPQCPAASCADSARRTDPERSSASGAAATEACSSERLPRPGLRCCPKGEPDRPSG